MPRTFDDGIIHVTEVDAFVECDDPLPSHGLTISIAIKTKIRDYVGAFKGDRSTLQLGIGNKPNAV